MNSPQFYSSSCENGGPIGLAFMKELDNHLHKISESILSAHVSVLVSSICTEYY